MLEGMYLFNPITLSLYTILLIFGFVYYTEKKSYLIVFALGFTAFLSSYIILSINHNLIDANMEVLGNKVFVFLTSVLFFYGVYLFIGRTFGSICFILCFSTLSLSFFIFLLLPSAAVVSYADYILLGIILAYVGITINRYWRRKYQRNNLFSYTFILWGIFKVLCPLINNDFSKVLNIQRIDIALCITASLGLLISHFYRKCEDLSRVPASHETEGCVDPFDELSLSKYAGSIDDRLKKTEVALKEREEQIRILTDNAKDLIYRFKLKPFQGFEYISPSVYEFTGYTQEEQYSDPMIMFNTMHPEDLHILYDKTTNALDYSKSHIQRWYHRDGSLRWLEEYCTPVYNSDGILVAIEGFCRDITERVQKEEEMSKSNCYDGLTGLKNRTYLHRVIDEASNSQVDPMTGLPGIIIANIGCLRDYNIRYGYSKSDTLIKDAAKIVKRQCRDCDEVFRISGSEFAIFLPQGDKNTVQSVSRNILQAVIDFNSKNPQLVLRLFIGYSYPTAKLTTAWDIFKDADINMYKNRIETYY